MMKELWQDIWLFLCGCSISMWLFLFDTIGLKGKSLTSLDESL